jgi:uncharacterized protein with PQ loop repeat
MTYSAVSILATAGLISSFLMNLTPIVSMREIIKAKSQLAYTTEPFMSGMIAAIINLSYSFKSGQTIVAISSAISIFLNLTYFSTHLRYSAAKILLLRGLLKRIVTVGIFMGIVPLIAYLISLKHSSVDVTQVIEIHFGVCSATISSYFYCAQLATFPQMIKSKDVSSISPPMTLGITISASLWAAYAYVQWDIYFIVCCTIGVFSCLVQWIMLAMFSRNTSNH